MEIKDYQSVGIIGPNGAGKSSLLRIMSKVYQPSTGEIKISGNLKTLIDPTAGIDIELTGIDNLYRLSLLQGISFPEIEKNKERTLDFAGLGDFINLPVRTYSSGMVLRLAFAVATSINPDILLLDEMISVGDSNFAHKAEKRMNEMIKKSKIVVFVSHNYEAISKYCNRFMFLNKGKLTEISQKEFLLYGIKVKSMK